MASGILSELPSESGSGKAILVALTKGMKGEYGKALEEMNLMASDSLELEIIAFNKKILTVISERNLKIGDDELRYQLSHLTPTSPNSNLPIEYDSLQICFNEYCKQETDRTDSISLSPNAYLLVSRGNKNLSKQLHLHIRDKPELIFYPVNISSSCSSVLHKIKPSATQVFYSILLSNGAFLVVPLTTGGHTYVFMNSH